MMCHATPDKNVFTNFGFIWKILQLVSEDEEKKLRTKVNKSKNVKGYVNYKLIHDKITF